MTEQKYQMTVAEIERNKGQTKLFATGEKENKTGPYRYYVVAKEDEQVEVGDVVSYESAGANFGWFIQVVSISVKSQNQT